jgi:hypothetical protein
LRTDISFSPNALISSNMAEHGGATEARQYAFLANEIKDCLRNHNP